MINTEDPWADPDYQPDFAPPMSDGFNRVVAVYCAAEYAKTGFEDPNANYPVPYSLTPAAEALMDAEAGS